MRTGIVGATGWLGSALTRALLGGGLAPASGLVLLNRSGRRPAEFDRPGVTWASNPADLVAQADAVVVSVRPQDLPNLGLSAPDRLVISFMAGVPLTALQSTLGGRVVRAMPNAAAQRGASYTPWLAGGDLRENDRTFVRRLLARIGKEDEVGSEDELDYLTGLSGSGAAYPALMAAAMLGHVRKRGLPEEVARRAVEAAVCDGAEMLRGRIEGAADLVGTYREYRGTTAAGLDAAEAAGFSMALRAALSAASDRAVRMWPPASSGRGDGPLAANRAPDPFPLTRAADEGPTRFDPT